MKNSSLYWMLAIVFLGLMIFGLVDPVKGQIAFGTFVVCFEIAKIVEYIETKSKE